MLIHFLFCLLSTNMQYKASFWCLWLLSFKLKLPFILLLFLFLLLNCLYLLFLLVLFLLFLLLFFSQVLIHPVTIQVVVVPFISASLLVVVTNAYHIPTNPFHIKLGSSLSPSPLPSLFPSLQVKFFSSQLAFAFVLSLVFDVFLLPLILTCLSFLLSPFLVFCQCIVLLNLSYICVVLMFSSEDILVPVCAI